MIKTKDGIFLLDKRPGYTSADELNIFKKLYHIKKAGHAGTLDKFASGLLLLATGKYTKVLESLFRLDKVYDFSVDFSYLTETLDTEGEIKSYFQPKLSSSGLREILPAFKGLIKQRPPQYSALKTNGKRYSDLARQSNQENQPIPAEREVNIYNLHLVRILTEKSARFLAHCSTGTYIRSLGRDLGKKIQGGGVTTVLRRRRIGFWNVRNACSLEILKVVPEKIEDCRVSDSSLMKLGLGIIISESEIYGLKMGKVPELANHCLVSNKNREHCFIYNQEKELVGLCEMVRNPEDNLNKMKKNVCQKEAHLWKITKLKVLA